MKWWKKYSAPVLAGVLAAGVIAQGGTLLGRNAASAEETEETQRTTLNIVRDSTDEETEAVEATAADESEDTAETAAETVSTEETEESERVTLNIGGSGSSTVIDDSEGAEASGETKSDEDTASDDSEEGSADSETENAEAEDTEAPDAAETEEAADSSDGDTQLGGSSEIETTETVSGSIVTTDVSEVIANCMPSIVSITNESASVEDTDTDSEYYYYYDVDGSLVLEEAEDTASVEETAASGIIIAVSDTELLIATNYHVVNGADELTVGFSVEAEDADDLTVSARVKGSNSGSDLAVVAVELSDIEESVRSQLKVATLGSSSDLKTGQAAIVISSNGYGTIATTGIISAQSLTVDVNDTSMDVILTDAADGTGSGGALLNASGEVVGICVADEGGDSASGVGYAIPIDTAIPVLEQLVNKETRDKLSDDERGYIGATVVTVSEEAADSYNMPAGAFVYEVTEGSAADEAGIKSGDIISAFAGESVSSSDELIEKMSYYEPGETVIIEVQTANNGSYEAREVEVTLQASSSSGSSSDEEEETEELPEEEDFFSEDEASPEDSERGSRGSSEDAGEDSEDEDGLPDDFDGDFGDGFDDGFDDGFEDYNSQFN
ncbi:MAG: trypsin-like peptidase domain-containing protein [Lachnospiraceae bacterium]|nr:trypsin-like peptidase domain-containing protein [Lachnospiraceae bacterium]